jgi:thiopeptide-type bacteriocin biosynthesis protein
VHSDFASDPTSSAVLDVLAGTSVSQVASRANLTPAELADAVETYHAAGQAALRTHAASRGWFAVRVQPTDWGTAEQAVAAHLGPHLQQAQAAGTLTTWWFVRKHPCWRLRLQPSLTATDVEVSFRGILDSLTETGVLARWSTAVYEPESVAFGGAPGMDIAHTLFHTDSANVLDYIQVATRSEDVLGRRELSILLCSIMFRAAQQDRYEQGDIWHRVATMRSLPTDIPENRLASMAEDLRQLLTADTAQLLETGGQLGFVAPWATGFHTAGRALADAAQHGTLLRGTRDVLAHHVIFHWNRLGLSATTQAILARAACHAVMNPPSTHVTMDGR